MAHMAKDASRYIGTFFIHRSDGLFSLLQIVDAEKNEYLMIFVEASEDISLNLVEFDFDVAKLAFFLIS